MNNGGPFRESRPVERRAASRSEQQAAPISRQTDEPQPVAQPERPKGQYTPAHSGDQPRSRKRLTIPFILVAVVIIAVVGWFVWSKAQDTNTAIETNKYQGIWLVNGEIYFGKLEQLNSGYFKLNDVFYIKPQSTSSDSKATDTKQSVSDQNNFELFKLGKEEIHGPEDVMMISKDQVLYYENLRDDGKVVKGIQKYNSSN